MIAADAVICDNKIVLSNESVLTGEADDLKKSREGDPFLLSSCIVKDAEECRAIVIGTGMHSQWGKIKANLVKEDVNTPLQDKLEDLANLVTNLLV
jgi:Ca2+-transporting ATPase